MIRLRQIDVNIEVSDCNLKKICAKKLHVLEEQISEINIVKKSIDARKKQDIYYCYEVDVKLREDKEEREILRKNKSKDIFKTPDEKYILKCENQELKQKKIVIVGSGPAGLFSAYMLAKIGCKPLIIERGEKIEERVKTVQKFWEKGILNTESNVQFGEGGAGTFSDGKLNTMVKDKEHRIRKILEVFVEMGAPKEILYENKPHIGTDILRNVIINLRNKILKMGGEFRYNSCLTNIILNENKVEKIEINGKEKIDVDILILAIGHSARDTFKMLHKNNINMEPKPFAVGVRVEHLQEMINKSQYGKFSKTLPPASYKLTYHASNGRGVYSFCMCPGGYVVNSSSQPESLAINGMSNFKRDTKNANSAIVVTVTPDDFENKLFGGLEFQEELERKAYIEGKGKIPVQCLGDYLENTKTQEYKSVLPVFKGEYEFANINNILPDFVNKSLKEAFLDFDRKIKGFASFDSILAAVETRTSSPVRILRNEDGESNVCGLYPIGEGAGYAGGIMSAAMDGLKVVEKICKSKKEIIDC